MLTKSQIRTLNAIKNNFRYDTINMRTVDYPAKTEVFLTLERIDNKGTKDSVYKTAEIFVGPKGGSRVDINIYPQMGMKKTRKIDSDLYRAEEYFNRMEV